MQHTRKTENLLLMSLVNICRSHMELATSHRFTVCAFSFKETWSEHIKVTHASTHLALSNQATCRHIIFYVWFCRQVCWLDMSAVYRALYAACYVTFSTLSVVTRWLLGWCDSSISWNSLSLSNCFVPRDWRATFLYDRKPSLSARLHAIRTHGVC